ncbi:hypothetical protein PPACK8108_LOCUS18480 [Phakopsora pachyrhizi]|uniref:Histidinol-phosphatase n=1 Tax=Phakopsora pachyrhizi TaxID=170000 RepID=A0AAV0BDD8_PHAPC|nr:hypothetical protein PPACK8108_LOCUS18480 [Phakopsora pachyrhizi]
MTLLERLTHISINVHHVNQIPIDFDLETFNRALCSFKPQTNASSVTLFDLCLLFHPKFYLTQHQSLWNQVARNIRLAISYGALFEVNSASIRKGWSTPYPSKPILSVSLCPFSFFYY